MRRVLLLHQPCDGGVGRHVSDLASGLGTRGYETVLCGPELPATVDSSQPYVPLDMEREITPRDIASIARFARIVADVKPDLIHAHSSKAGAVARLARPFHPRVPVLYTPHGYAFGGYFSSSIERHAYREIERMLATVTSRVVCVCDAEARLARTVGSPARVRVVHNGIEPSPDGTPDPLLDALRQTDNVICAITLLRPGKGIETLIDALPTVLARHKQTRIVIAGDGPELEILRERAARRNVLDALLFIGRQKDTLALLRAADVFVHPSWAEAFPYVVLEAMSAGISVVASDVGGIREAIEDEVSGLLVPPRDPDALGAALSDVLANPQRRTAMGRAARQRLEGHFTRDHMLDGLARVYGELVRPLRSQ